jgi:hypothetical protein
MRVVADDPHVGELHGAGLLAQCGPQQPDLVGVQDGQDRLAAGQPFADECRGGGHELALARVEECLVPEGGVEGILRR